jgi:hypothetical protein
LATILLSTGWREVRVSCGFIGIWKDSAHKTAGAADA